MCEPCAWMRLEDCVALCLALWKNGSRICQSLGTLGRRTFGNATNARSNRFLDAVRSLHYGKRPKALVVGKMWNYSWSYYVLFRFGKARMAFLALRPSKKVLTEACETLIDPNTSQLSSQWCDCNVVHIQIQNEVLCTVQFLVVAPLLATWEVCHKGYNESAALRPATPAQRQEWSRCVWKFRGRASNPMAYHCFDSFSRWTC